MTKSLKEKKRLNYIKNIRNEQKYCVADKDAFRFKYSHSISSYYDQVDSPKEIKIFKSIYKKLFSFVRGNITHKDNKKLRNYIEDILVSTYKNLDIFEFKIVLHFLPAFVGTDEISFYLVASIYNGQNNYIGEINFNHFMFNTDHMIVFNKNTKGIRYDSLQYFNEQLDKVEKIDKAIIIRVGKSYKHLNKIQQLFTVCQNYKNEIDMLKENPDFLAYDENVNSYSTTFNVNDEITHYFSVNRKLIYLPSLTTKTSMGESMAAFLRKNQYKISSANKYTSISCIDYKKNILEDFIKKGFFDQSLVESYNHEKHSFEEMMEMNALHLY